MFSAVVKTELGSDKTCLKRELDNYNLPAVASSQYIRVLLDVVGAGDNDTQVFNESEIEGPLCMVFEWMEHDLRAVPSERYRKDSNLPKVIAKSVLSALALLKTQHGAIHTGESVSSASYQLLNI